ncbi:serine protease autotransporter EspP, partial [Escherichia coli]|nr:serine protease autotransporter EspP [Escherichia coli]HCX7381483.1 serine protease autotransporter EspP [Escherichia coli]
KYSHITGGLIAVSELSGRVSSRATSKKKHKRILALCFLGLLPSSYSFASQMDISNFYIRDYMDFAQNKGIFQAGATNIEIVKKDGSTLKLPEVPFPDFSPVANKGSTTSIGGAYSITATHNTKNHHSVATQNWGNSTYKQTDWNTSHPDFAVSRLDKFVVETRGATEGADISLSKQQALERYGVNYKGEKKLIAFRAGSGVVSVKKNGRITPFNEVSYKPEMLNGSFVHIDDWSGWLILTNNQFDEFNNIASQGDSGSALFVYDNQKKKWVVAGTVWGIYNYANGKNHAAYSKWNQTTIDNLKNKYSYNVDMSGAQVATIENGKLTGTGSETTDIKNKDLIFTGGGDILLKSSFDNGAGGLVFNDKKTYRVNGDDFTFKGAGVDTRNGSTVEWNIRYDNKDNLHKIGDGTLDVRKTQNTNLKTGEGLVILGAEKTFNNIYITSGDGTVRLNAENALSGGEYNGIFFAKNGGTLDLNGYNQSFNKIAATDSGAVITNTSTKKSILSLNNTADYIYHGNINGNLDVLQHHETKKENRRLILDGGVDTTNDISLRNTQLSMQGHATEHAIYRDGAFSCSLPAPMRFLCGSDYVAGMQNTEADAVKQNGNAYKTNNAVSDLSQPDWETGTFRFGTLHLENSDFSVGRNANVIGDIQASKSNITIGDTTAYIDLHAGKNITGDGFGFRQNIVRGNSQGETLFTGGITAEDSTIVIKDKAKALFSNYVYLLNTKATIEKGADVTTQSGMFSTSDISVSGNLSMTGNPDKDNKFEPSIYLNDASYLLTDDSARLVAKNKASVVGDIHSTKSASIMFGHDESDLSQLSDRTSKGLALGLLGGFDVSYRGSVNAPSASATMNNTWWQLTGDSALKTLKSTNSMVYFTDSANNKKFHTLTVDELATSNSAYAMRTDLNNSDKLVVNKKLSGKDNILLVDFLNKPSGEKLDIELVSAPGNSSKDVFKGSEQAIGFSNVTPVITTRETDDKITWSLTGYNTVANKEATRNAAALFSVDYKAFLNEVNNLNKRMGDLRDINGEAGAWARIMSGTGSASGGFSDNYTHVQVGVDKKHELDGLDLFTGFTVTHTDSSASADVFSGKTKSVGAGLYASAMFDSGAYIDLIGKYVHHDNEYTATFAGLGTRDYSTHSWYAGAEAGYRCHVTEDTWIEPQAELVYGAVSGKQFAWKDQGMHLSMKDKDYNPLIGRTGVDVGKSFSGKDWKVTARAGLGYQFDLLANGETVLRDASGEKRIKGEKDSRMLMSVGLNAEIRDNVRFGLEFEKSAFGKYNVDNAVNANFRYSF